MKILTLQETADRLRVSVRTLYNRLSQGRAENLHAFKIYGGWRVPEEAVEEVLTRAQEEYAERGANRRAVKGARGSSSVGANPRE